MKIEHGGTPQEKRVTFIGLENTEFSGRDILGVGVDVRDIAQLARDLEIPSFIEDNFTASEIAYCEQAKGRGRAERYAARWAGKEAVAKALGGIPVSTTVGGIPAGDFTEVEIVRNEVGKPSVKLYGRAQERAEQVGLQALFLSLSHEKTVAIAFCIAVK